MLPGSFKKLLHRFLLTTIGDTSQHGETLVVLSLLGNGCPRYIVDVGANDGKTCSNSYWFLKKGWNVLLIEPNPAVFERLTANTKHYPNARRVMKACSSRKGHAQLELMKHDSLGVLSRLRGTESGGTHAGSSTVLNVETDTLTDILLHEGIPGDFALLSIDTEGHDADVLAGLDFEVFQPRVIIVESGISGPSAELAGIMMSNRYECRAVLSNNTVWLRSNRAVQGVARAAEPVAKQR